jgi:hypothetical protein
VIFGPDIIEEVEMTVHRVQESLKATKSRQETYANKRHQPLVFKVTDQVDLSLTDERRKEVWGERKVSTSLHRTVPHPREV